MTDSGPGSGSVPIHPPPPPNWFIRTFRQIYAISVWVVFFGILFILSNFLSLFFLTFILSYTINSLVVALGQRVTWPRWAVIISVFAAILLTMTAMGMIVFPKVYQEGKTLSLEIPEAKDKLIGSIRGILQDESWGVVLKGAGLEEGFQEFFTVVLQNISTFAQKILRISFHFILSLVFSFLILWDLDRLVLEIQSLKSSRLGKPFKILAPKISKFGDIVGRAFEAQIVIAIVNTILTLIGLTLLGIPSKLFLSVFVFVCSFIPVVGVIISSIPICLLGYKTAGLILAFQAAFLIVIIHFIEAYILNPRIVGGHLSVHPFIAVCILVFSENWFGVWGLLLGVPCAIFIYRSLIDPPKNEGKTVHPFIAVCILVFAENWFGVWGLLLGVPCAIFIYQSLINPARRDPRIPLPALASVPSPANPVQPPAPDSEISSQRLSTGS